MDNNTIPNAPYTPAELLQRARDLDVPGQLISRGSKLETRGYPVRLQSGEIITWMICAAPELHYTGRQ